MLENILTHPTSTATGIDLLCPIYKEIFYENLKISGFIKKVKIIKGFSQIELKKLPHNFYDIIYIDGDHRAAAVLSDALLCWHLLKKGGILIFDDYLWEKDKLPPDKRPEIAIDTFVELYKDYIDILHKGYQYIIRKKEKFYWENNKKFFKSRKFKKRYKN